MKGRIAVLLSIVTGLLCGPAAAGNDAAAAGAAQVAHAPAAASAPSPRPDTAGTAATVPPRGSLYRIRHRGHTSYLFGTIHVGTSAFFPLEPEVMRALAQASKLVLEIDVRRTGPFQDALRKHGMYGDGDDVSRHLSPAALAELRRALQQAGLEWDAMRRYKPWLLANLLLGLDLERGGYRRTHGVEMFLLSLADAQTKAVQELESAEYQMSLFDGMDDAAQEQYLREQLAELGDGKAMRKAQALIAAWAAGNGDEVESLLQESLREDTLSSAFTYRVLLQKRNPEMAEKILRMLERDESAFVGVGLLHLVGESGLPVLLRARGVAVEKVY